METKLPSQKTIKRWMKNELKNSPLDYDSYGEVNTTHLAEVTAWHFESLGFYPYISDEFDIDDVFYEIAADIEFELLSENERNEEDDY